MAHIDTNEIVWMYGRQFGTLRRLFESDPPPNLPMPRLLCPRCKSPITEKTILGVDET